MVPPFEPAAPPVGLVPPVPVAPLEPPTPAAPLAVPPVPPSAFSRGALSSGPHATACARNNPTVARANRGGVRTKSIDVGKAAHLSITRRRRHRLVPREP